MQNQSKYIGGKPNKNPNVRLKKNKKKTSRPLLDLFNPEIFG